MQCSIPECRRAAVRTVKVGSKETRRLCSHHLEIYADRKRRHVPVFYKASNMPE